MEATQDRRERRAVIYLRVASSHKHDASTIDRQREGCLRIAARQGVTVVREYADIGRAARLEQQVELLRLLDDLHQKRDVAYVIIWDYARLARSMEQLNWLVHHFHACGAQLVTNTGVEAVDLTYSQEQQNMKGGNS